MPHPEQMSCADTALLVIDVQEKLMPLISGERRVIDTIEFLIDGAALLNIPVLATEQYPKGLGSTVSPLREKLPNRPDKLAFSCAAVPEVVEALYQDARHKVVLAGIEAHVCVMQTALDLMALDFRVYLPVDAISSRFDIDRDYAFRRLERLGAVLTTAETVLFECVGSKEHPAFKDISKLVQQRMQRLSEMASG